MLAFVCRNRSAHRNQSFYDISDNVFFFCYCRLIPCFRFFFFLYHIACYLNGRIFLPNLNEISKKKKTASRIPCEQATIEAALDTHGMGTNLSKGRNVSAALLFFLHSRNVSWRVLVGREVPICIV